MDDAASLIRDYVLVLRRRKWWFLVPAALVLAVALPVAQFWPATYRSSATILIEDPDVPQELVSSLVTGYIEKRLEEISRRVLATESLATLIERHRLWADEQEQLPTPALVAKMRDSIERHMIRANVVDAEGEERTATTAFEVSFAYADPQMAQNVTDDLVSLYLEQNRRQRREFVDQTTGFLRSERERAEGRVREVDARLAAFKAANTDILPERRPYNEEQVSRAEQELRDLDRTIQSLKERESYIAAQLAQVDPYLPEPAVSPTGGSPEAQLDSLRTELATASARYGPDHPDVDRLRRAVEALTRTVQAGGGAGRSRLQQERARLRAELAMLRERYRDDHPDVRRIQRELESVEGALRAAPAVTTRGRGTAPVRNPAYLSLEVQLAGIRTELATTQEQLARVQEVRAHAQELVARTPLIETDYRNLERELADARSFRNAVIDKELTARLGESLEKEAKGERLSLLEPASLPSVPEKPDRRLLQLLGIMLALGTGATAVILRHLLDGAVWTTRELTTLFGVAPLAVVPHVTTRGEQWRHRATVALVLAGLLSGLAGGAWWADRHYGSVNGLASELHRRTVETVSPYLPAIIRPLFDTSARS